MYSSSPDAGLAPAEAVATSKVIHVRGLPPGADSSELISVLSKFGPVAYVMMLPRRGQALVEMLNMPEAIAAVSFAASSPLSVGGKHVYLNYSRSNEINRAAAERVHDGGAVTSAAENVAHEGEHIIMMTVFNPFYPITVDVLHTILKPYGDVLRIVIFTKKGVQAFAEFRDPSSAAHAQAALNGKQIYDGCCQLKIVFSKTQALTVRVNNERTFDYTNPSLPTGPHPEGPAGGPQFIAAAAAGLGAPAGAPPHAAYPGAPAPWVPSYPGAPAAPAYPPYGVYPGNMDMYGAHAHAPHFDPRGHGGDRGMPPGPHGGAYMAAPGNVVIMYNIPARFGVQQVFNLASMYGNVVRIKMMRSKDAVLIQMEDHVQAEGTLSHLAGLSLFGKTLQGEPSRHSYIAEPRVREGGKEDDTPDGEFADYSASALNRFKRPEHFRHIYRPAPTVHFSNCPPTFDEARLMAHFAANGAPAPKRCKFFQPRTGGDGDKKAGLVEFGSVQEAAEALALANNVVVDGHTVRLAFSANTL